MGTTIGAKEAKARESGMTKCLRSVLKMRIIKIGVITEALVFMRNYKHREFIVQENGWHG